MRHIFFALSLFFLQVRFAINAYNTSESCESGYQDKMVDLTVTIIKREAVNAVLSHFVEGKYND